MDASLSEFKDALTLKRDGRRVSLEGIITGSALGLFLVYQLRDKQAPLANIDIGADEPWLTGVLPPDRVGSRPISAPLVAAPDELSTDSRSAFSNHGLGGGISPQPSVGISDSRSNSLGGGRSAELSTNSPALPQYTDPRFETSSSINHSDRLSPLGGEGGRVGGFAPSSRSRVSSSSSDQSGRTTGLTPPRSPDYEEPSLQNPNHTTTRPAQVLPTSGGLYGLFADWPGTSTFDLTRIPPFVPPPIQDPAPLPPPKILIVQVDTSTGAVANSLNQETSASTQVYQAALDGVALDLRGSDRDQVLLISSQQLTTSSQALGLEKAILDVNSVNLSVRDTLITAGQATDALLIKTSDLSVINISSSGASAASVDLQTVAMQASKVVSQQSPLVVDVNAESRLNFFSLSDLSSSSYDLNIVSTALDNSSILLGDSSDIIRIFSSVGNPDSPEFTLQQRVQSQTADLDRVTADDPAELGHLSVAATALGMVGSLIDTAGGDDKVSVVASVNVDASVSPADLSRLVVSGTLQSVALFNSSILLGEGNDAARVQGAVVDSLIDLGSGSNQLYLDGPVFNGTVRSGDGSTSVALGNTANTLTVDSSGSIRLNAGNQSDIVTLTSLPSHAFVDAGIGSDLVILDTAEPLQARVVAADRTIAASVSLINTESLRLTALDDRISMLSGGSLSGSLDGGKGTDIIDYSNYGKSISVDLDAGAASGIGSGAPSSLLSVESVVGTPLADTFVVSSKAGQYVDAGAAEDLVYLKWTPWSALDSDKSTSVFGGGGRDKFVLVGVADSFLPSTSPSIASFVLPDLHVQSSFEGSISLSDELALGSLSSILSVSGASGIGNAKLLPIAPLDSLVSGISSVGRDFSQIAIAYDPIQSSPMASMLSIASSAGVSSYSTIAMLPNFGSNTFSPSSSPVF